MTRVLDRSPTPAAALERLAGAADELQAAVLIDERGELVVSAGDDLDGDRLADHARDLLAAADAAAARGGLEAVERVEVSRPDGGVFAIREADRDGRRWTAVAVVAGGALPALVLYDLRMAVLGLGRPG